MREELLHYYERELTFIRRMGAEFAQRYPKVAGRLMLEPNKCEDPHVERMLEAFAFIAARVHLRIDDDFPEISETLLNIVYPHFVRPIPAMSIVELALDPEQGKLTTGYRIPRGTMLYSRPVDGVPCKFRSCYDVTIWPISVAAAQWTTPDRLRPPARLGDSAAVLRIELRCAGDTKFSQLNLNTLRFYLDGPGNLTAALYELLNTSGRSIVVREVGVASPKMVTLPASSLQPGGLGADEGMLPYPGRSFEAYRLIQEYFVFPEKYLFLDLGGFNQIAAAGMGNAIEILIPVPTYERVDWRAMLEAGVNHSTIKLGCTPVINLFSHVAEPVLVTQRKPDYLVVPDARRRLTTEIFSVDDVLAVTPESERPIAFRPFYAPSRHARPRNATAALNESFNDDGDSGLYWQAKRRASGWRTDEGTDILLSFVDRSGRTAHPDQDTVTARVTCFNSDLPSRLAFGNPNGDFELEGAGPVKAITALIKPTRVIQPPLGSGQTWRLISQLSLNYLSLADSGVDALRETLRLYDFADSVIAQKQISGIMAVKSAPTFARIVTEHGLTFARGRRVEVEFDEESFTGGGVFLFGTVLERFLGLYASINSFSVLSTRSRQRKRAVHEWAPRAGWKPLL